MPRLYRVADEHLGDIDEAQLDDLIDALEEDEDEAGQSYFVDAETLGHLAAEGVDPAVLALLRPAVGEDGCEIYWEEGEDEDEDEDEGDEGGAAPQ